MNRNIINNYENSEYLKIFKSYQSIKTKIEYIRIAYLILTHSRFNIELQTELNLFISFDF
jgi:hypothetical protein